MADERLGISEYLGELERDCQKLLDHAREASEHYANSKPASAAMVLGLMHYPLGHVSEEVSGLLRDLDKREGITPQAWLDDNRDIDG